MLEMVTAEVPEFFSVVVNGGLVVETTWVPNTRVLGVIVKLVPMPLRFTICGLVGSVSVMVRVPVLTPVSDGVNVMLMAQLLFTAIPPAQFEVWVNSGPEIEMLGAGKRVVPKLLTVTVLAGLGWPTLCCGNVRPVVETGEHCRVFRTKGDKGVCVKSKLSNMSFAAVSRSVSGARLKRSSTIFRKEENSYVV